MADDNHSRFRPTDPYGRGSASAAPSNDPLAELARLIGQNSGGADYGRSLAQPTAPGYGNAAPSYDQAPQSYPDNADPSYGEDGTASYEAEPHHADERPVHGDWQNGSTPSPQYRPDDQYPLPLPNQAPLPGARAYDSGYGQQDHGHQEQDHEHYAGQSYADPLGPLPRDNYRPDPDFEPAAYSHQTYQQPLYPQEPGAGAMPPPHDDEFYDDAPGGRRRRGVMTVVAVLTLAVVGTAAAFGYRSLFGGPSVPDVAPVIRASSEPAKVAPPPAPDQTATKFTYDRFSDAGKDEKIVPRDEKPLDLSKLAPASMTPAAPPRPQGGAAAAANPPSAIGDPRRVRTVPIRPSQPDVAAVVAPLPAPAAPPRQTVATTDPPVAADPPQAAPRVAASSKVAARPARASHSSPAATNGPLSLSPDANNALPPPAPARESAPRSSAPARVASAPAAGGASGGGYLVQVSSQKSETDAEAAYRGISSKYSSVISGKPHTVRRADLGSKGIYYRAMVGPFASREQAVSLCASLKQAGGDCVVQH